MPLTDDQIERYSRQIILPAIGGRGQERLNASSALLIGEIEDLELPLSYLAGAGLGTIMLLNPVADARSRRAIAHARRLNPDVKIQRLGNPSWPSTDLGMMFIGSTWSARAARSLAGGAHQGASIVVRLDERGAIGILPSPPPCPVCAYAELFHEPGQRAPDAGFATMVATAAAVQILAGAYSTRSAMLTEFSGIGSTTRELAAAHRIAACVCGAAESGGDDAA